jgi:hypothetical protein
MSIDRRTFIRNVAAAGAGIAGLLPRTARAQTWGTLPATSSWPTPSKILEIFCYSGMSQWETFWVMGNAGGGVNFQNFDQNVAELSWHCVSGPLPANQTNLFGTDAGGNKVYWGPATKPLWRSDIISRTRMVALQHSLPAHALAIPYTLTGKPLGNPRAAGMGSAVQHQQISQSPRALPYAYVIASLQLPWEFTVGAAAANGAHPGYAQPLVVRTGDTALLSQLQRGRMNAASDNLLRTYHAVENDRLRYQGHDPVRSTGFSSYSSSLSSVLNAPALYTQLNSVNLVVPAIQACASAHLKSDPSGTNSSQLPAQPDDVQTELQLATSLLTSGGARYVCVIDHGLDLAAGTPYDLHDDTDAVPLERILANNVFNLCSQLANQIDPTGTDPTKLHLADTLIIIHSEFGRTPQPDTGSLHGRNHWPYGYAAILIGGLLPSTSAIVGGINSDGIAFGPGGSNSNPLSPTDIRGALLIAAGIDPMAQENYGVSDFSSLITQPVGGETGEEAIRENLKTQVLGL